MSAPSNTPTLTELAAQINEALQASESERLRAGRMLLEAREIFDATKAEGDSWQAWCARNIRRQRDNKPRTYRDIKRLMALARAPDPAAAVAREREAARVGMAATRAREAAEGTNVCLPVLPSDDEDEEPAANVVVFPARQLFSPDPRKRCPVCDSPVKLTPAGNLYAHHAPGTPAATNCDGSGKPPKHSETRPEIIAPQAASNSESDNQIPKTRRVLAKNNKRYTKNDFALDIVRHFASQFKEGDTFLDPCCGDGAFIKALTEILPEETRMDWCEIDPDTDWVQDFGPIDFLGYTDHRTWGITNTPWSADEYAPIFRHALEVCDNIVFLIRVQNATTTARRNEWEAAGFGLKEIAICHWQDAGFPPEGLELAALHWQRGYKGDTRYSKIELAHRRFERYKAFLAEIAAGADSLETDQLCELYDLLMGTAKGFNLEPPAISEAEAAE